MSLPYPDDLVPFNVPDSATEKSKGGSSSDSALRESGGGASGSGSGNSGGKKGGKGSRKKGGKGSRRHKIGGSDGSDDDLDAGAKSDDDSDEDFRPSSSLKKSGKQIETITTQ